MANHGAIAIDAVKTRHEPRVVENVVTELSWPTYSMPHITADGMIVYTFHHALQILQTPRSRPIPTDGKLAQAIQAAESRRSC
ncbi:hypothetical protein [Nonomuraea basaltis]|uniref:hypothetical protein n=1 Tax=Nonomuraea basaltis TaxID=2495887 RepID=UPI00110C4FC9|nr:hypothetical protein [Nonomuraea basaltis]TMR99582.1 hypothetical protein EJK15_07145 [Nonomuraea basaltis]